MPSAAPLHLPRFVGVAALSALTALGLTAGCTVGPRNAAAASEKASAPVAVAPVAVAPVAQAARPAGAPAAHACGGGEKAAAGTSACAGEQPGHECQGHGTEPVRDSAVRAGVDPGTGAAVTSVGAPLAGVSTVKVADLMAHPRAYSGKTVRLEGDVTSMCFHKRGWFAVQDPGDRTGTVVRVVTAPAFLVPEGSVGRKARAEGVVQVVEVDAAEARHFAASHGVGSGEGAAGDAPVKAVVVRATGTEFL